MKIPLLFLLWLTLPCNATVVTKNPIWLKKKLNVCFAKSREDLKKYDISPGFSSSHDLTQENELGLDEEKIGPMLPFSTMHSFMNQYYSYASEKMRFICSPSAAHPDRSVFELVSLAWGLHPILNAHYEKSLFDSLCDDQTYLEFNPKYMFEHHTLLDHVTQSAIRFLYKHTPVEKFNSDDFRKINYIQNTWMRVRDLGW